MPFPREYTPRHRWVMTLAMWLVLAASLGVAAVISRAPTAAAVDLAGPHDVGEVRLDLPKGWTVRDQGIVFVRKRLVASEPPASASAQSARVVAVTVEADSDRFSTDVVEEAMLQHHVIEPRFYDPQFRMGPTTGLMMGGDRHVGLPRRGEAGGFAVAVAAIPGTSRLVRLEIESPRLGRGDLALLRRMADTIEFRTPVAGVATEASATRPGDAATTAPSK